MRTEQDFISIVRQYDDIILYGCGNVGVVIQKELKRYGIFPKCFIVSKEREEKSIDGIPIYEISKMSDSMKNSLVVVSTNASFHEEIRKSLEAYDVKEIVFVSDNLIEEIVSNRKTLYTNALHERDTHWQYKDDYCVRDALFESKYKKLIQGLDKESIKTVDLILERLERIFSTELEELDVFNEREKRELDEIKRSLWDKIVEKDENVYAFENYMLPQNYFDPNVYFHECGIKNLKTLDKISRGNIIDAGAFIGDSSLMFAKRTSGKVYAWEAMKENCQTILKTIQMNNVNNIEVVNKAIGDRCQFATIKKGEILNWSTMVPYESREYVSTDVIEMQSIDAFVEENNVEVALIKLHVEGMEYDAIRGAERTLRKQKPALLIHIHHTPKDFFEIKPYIEELNLGYTFKIFKPVNECVFTGTMLLAECLEIT